MSNQESYPTSSYLPDSRYQADLSSTSNPFPIKSVLKRSKSFENETQKNSLRIATSEYFNHETLDNVNDEWTTQEILERVRLIIYHVLESDESTVKLVNFCCKIVKNTSNGVYFLDSLFCCVREWILEKNRLKAEKWIRLVNFLAQLYQNIIYMNTTINCAHGELSKSSSSESDNEELIEIFQNISLLNNNSSSSSSNNNNNNNNNNNEDFISNIQNIESENIDKTRQIKMLSGLLLDCVLYSIKYSGNDYEVCIMDILRCFGESLERINPIKMKQIINYIRDQLLLENRKDKKLLLEIIELSASNWQFKCRQEIYYFPFIKF